LSNYELGLKTSSFDNTLVWDTAIYNEDWNKFQFSFLGPNDLTIIENAPQANIKGIETQLSWNATRQFTLNAGATYTHAVLSKNFCGTDQSTGQLIPSCANVDAVAVSGTPLPYTPDFKGYVSGRYTATVFDWEAFGQASVTYQTLNHVGLRTSDNAELGTMPAYATVDLAAGASRGGLSFELSVRNLLDARGQENRYTTCPVQLCSSTVLGVPHSVYVVPIVPRTISLKLEQKF
jgi:outer membrane receptor protein involved in Fe transport